jgi:Trypsin-like peptidase domain
VEGPVPGCLQVRTEEPKLGEELFVLGAPAGPELSFSATRGIVSGVRDLQGHRYVQTDAPMNPGNSGGPLVDSGGFARGIVSRKVVAQDMEGLGFGVTIEHALAGLGLKLSSHTSEDLLKGSSQEAHKPRAIDDRADAKPLIVAPVSNQPDDEEGSRMGGHAEPEELEPRPGVLPLRWVSFGVGSAAAVTALLTYVSVSPTAVPSPSYYSARTINDVACVLALAGAVGFGVSWFIPLQPRGQASRASSWTGFVAPVVTGERFGVVGAWTW